MSDDDERDSELRALIEDAIEARAPSSTQPQYPKDDRYRDLRRDLEATVVKIEARGRKTKLQKSRVLQELADILRDGRGEEPHAHHHAHQARDRQLGDHRQPNGR